MRYDITIDPMKYTMHFSKLLRFGGLSQLDTEQLKTVMNIVHIEGRLRQLEDLQIAAQQTEEPHRFDLAYFTEEKKRYALTKDIDPGLFFKQLLKSDVLI